MITLAADCLVFRMAGGESIPFSADMLSVEVMGDTARRFDPEFVRDAAKAVFHFFRYEQGRQTVTVAEFAEALERVLSGFNPPPTPESVMERPPCGVVELDLGRMASESGAACELIFFPRLRRELRHQMQESTQVVRFHGLRECAKRLAGARKWTGRCQSLSEQIVAYLRECLVSEAPRQQFSMMVCN